MPTNRQICSDIVDYLKANNIDDRISYRYILSELRDVAQNYIKQDADNRRIFNQSSLWKTIACPIELEEVSLIDCNVDIQDTRTVSKSKKRLPKTYITVYGDLLKVSGVDGGGTYTQIRAEDYEDELNRKFRNNSIKYYWIIDDYLYMMDAPQAIRVSGFFKEDDYLTFCECGSTQCFKPLDMEFNCPDYLVKVVKEDVKRQLLARYNIVSDQKPNLNPNDK